MEPEHDPNGGDVPSLADAWRGTGARAEAPSLPGTLSPGISLVIPAWNDADRLKPTLQRFIAGFERSGRPYEILVVADGCEDDTVGLVRSLGRPSVDTLSFPNRLGKGRAVQEGLARARFDRCGFIDADTTLSFEQFERLLHGLETAGASFASRWPPGQPPRFHADRTRNMLSIGWSVLVRALLLTTVRDTQCGAKLFRTRPLHGLLRAVTIQGWAFDIALLYHWQRASHSYREIPVEWGEEAGSKLVAKRVMPMMFLSLVGLRLIHTPLGRWIPSRARFHLRRNLGRLAARMLAPRPAGGES